MMTQLKKIPRGLPYLQPKDVLNGIRNPAGNGKVGKYVEIFKKEFADQFGANFVIAFPYARTALYFLLKALQLPPESEVITTPLTISEIINSIVLNGLRPVFVDLGHNSGNIDISKIENNITNKTRVILITHLKVKT